MRRSATWRRLYDPASGLIEPRYASGAFLAPTTTSKAAASSRATPTSTPGWCPRTPPASSARWAGRAKAAARLDHFLRELNGSAGGTHTDHALLGNEPTLQTPWLYDWTRRPYRTQEAVRRALALYDTSPDGYPGNDDLGTLSAWYVFGALGLYPEVPGVGLLAIGSPLFGRAAIAPAAPQAGADHRQRLHVQEAEAREGQEAPSRRSRAKSPSARRALHTYAGCSSTATPTASPGPPTARCPRRPPRLPARPQPNRKWGTPPPPCLPRSARTGGCRKAPARPELALGALSSL